MGVPIENRSTDLNGEREVVSREGTETCRKPFDPAELGSLTLAICGAVATIQDRQIATVGPLHDHFDVDALEQLVRTSTDGSAADALTVSFEVDGVDVTVSGDGFVVACKWTAG